MPNMELLAAELARPEFAGLTAAQAADYLNAAVMPVEVTAKAVVKYLALVDRWGALADAADHDADPARRRHCRNFVDILKTFDDFDLEDAAVAAVVSARLDELIGDGFLTAGDKTAILALGDNGATRAQAAGIGDRVDPADVLIARAG